MKDFPTQRQFIKAHKELSDSSLEMLKKEYRRLYFKEYNKHRRAVKKVSLRLTQKEYDYFENKRKSYTKKSFNRFVIDTAIAYLENSFIQHDPELIRKLILAVNATGNNINQIVHQIHLILLKSTENTYSADFSMESLYRILEGYEELKKCTEALKQLIVKYTSAPPTEFISLNWDEVKNDKQKLKDLIIYLDEHLSTLI